MRVRLSPGPTIRRRSLPATRQPVLVNHQSIQSHRSPGVDFVCADAYFCAEAEAHAVGEARAAIPELARRIYAGTEAVGDFFGCSHDGVRVMRSVSIDVLNRGIDGGMWCTSRCDGPDGQDEVEEFSVVVGI